MSCMTRPGIGAGLLLAAVLASACGGGGGSGSDTGVFLDGPVAGLRYEGPRFSGTTDAEGRYQYEAGDEVCFFLGFIELGCGPARGIVSPIDLFPDATSEDDRVLNVVRFLLSLDLDGDPGNGIDVREVQTLAPDAAIDFDQTSEAFGADPLVLAFVDDAGFDGDLVDEETAALHLAESLADSFYFEQRLFGDWIYTMYTGEAVTLADTVKIDEQELLATEGDVTEEGEVFFVLDGEGDELCYHEGAFEGDDFVGGEVDCVDPLEIVDAIALDGFRLDRIDPDRGYALADLEGGWRVLWVELDGEIFFDEETIADLAASVSSRGVVRFELEGCAWRGQMNLGRSFVSGNVTCEGQANGAFTMEPLQI